MYIRKRWIYLSLAILISIALGYVYIQFFQKNEAEEVCCAKHYLTPPKVLTITESTPIPILDSSKANQQVTYNILNQVQEGLMRLGTNNNPVLGLAESYQVSPDYRTYTFSIRKNAVWSDGVPVTANDFKFAWERALSPANQYEYSFLFYPIHNAESYSNGEVGFDQVGINVPDDKHITIQLDKPDPNFLSLLTLTSFLPQRDDLVKKYGEKFATSPETMSFTGPYKLKAFNPQSAGLVKNPAYWDVKHVTLPEVVVNVNVDASRQVYSFKAESTGMVKLDESKFNQFKNNPNLKRSKKAIVDFLEMNRRNKLLNNKNIRRAIQLAINRDSLVTSINNGSIRSNGILPTFQKEDTKQDPLQFDLSKSKSLLQKGCSELKIDCSIELNLITYNIPHFQAIASQVKKQLESIGLKVSISNLDVNEKSKLDSEGKFDLSVAEWPSYYMEPIDNLKLWHSNDSRNISGFSNKNYDGLVKKAESESNLKLRGKFIKDAEQLLVNDEAAVIPLLNRNDLRLQKSYVKNVLYHPFGADYSLKWATYQPPKKVEATK